MLTSHGSPNAPITFLGEAPGEDEIRQGRPFVGRSGQFLKVACANASITLDNCYLTNVFSERPPDNNVGYFFQDRDHTIVKPEHQHHLDRAITELQTITSNLIIAVGNTALWFLTGLTGILNHRGSILQSRYSHHKVIPIIHPAAALRQFGDAGGNYSLLISLDLRKCKREAASPTINIPQLTMTTAKTYKDAVSVLEELHHADVLSVDIECSPGVINCIGFAPTPTEGYCIPFTYQGSYMHSLATRTHLWQQISRLLHTPIPKVGQNYLFDSFMLARRFRIRPVNIWRDTMIAHHYTYPDMPKGLDFLTSLYTNHPYYKDEGKEWRNIQNYEMFWNYNIKDCCITLEVANALESHINALGTGEVVATYHALTFGPLLKSMLHGTRYDNAYIDAYRLQLEGLVAKLQSRLNLMAGGKINVNSPKQIATLLYDTLGYPTQYKTVKKKRVITTDEDAILKLAHERPNPILDIILSIRGLAKHISTSLDMTVDTFTSRVHTYYNPCGTATGRLSSSEAIGNSGGNLQNTPRPGTEKDMLDTALKLLENPND